MSNPKLVKNLRLSNVFILLLTVFFSCTLLIFINFFTIKILSASRAYVNGESHYSKSQKEASRHLLTYLYTKDQKQWRLYQEEMKVPQGDATARKILLKFGDDKIAREGFLIGRCHQDDVDDMIWLFINFKEVSFFAKAIFEWEQADTLIYKLSLVGKEVNYKIEHHKLTTVDQLKLLHEISDISDKLSFYESNFSSVLGEVTRKIKSFLIITNIFFIFIIIASVSFYYSIMLKRLLASKKEIEVNNENLIAINQELDRFVYSASHDLRSPIVSLKGLVKIAQEEEDISQVREYLNLMDQSLAKQDQFLSDIIDYSKNKLKQVIVEPVSLHDLLDETISQLTHMENANRITVHKDFLIDKILSDGLRLKIIISNLVSNAIKYCDASKNEMFISVKTYIDNDLYKIEIADNGIGIKDEYKEHVLEMYFGTDKNKGSGLGLYIVKEAVENIGGSISLTSEGNIGSTFIISFPRNEI